MNGGKRSEPAGDIAQSHGSPQWVGCHAKASFRTAIEATKRAKIMRRRHEGRFTAYHCRVCRGWHIGSRDNWQG